MLNSEKGIVPTPTNPDGSTFANNIVVMINGEINKSYNLGTEQLIDGNLYWKVNTRDIEPLLDGRNTVGELVDIEQNSIGDFPKRGTDPLFTNFILNVVNPATHYWALHPNSEFFNIWNFIPSGNSPATVGAVTVTCRGVSGQDELGNDYCLGGLLPDSSQSSDIGAIPSTATANDYQIFPFNYTLAEPPLPPANNPPVASAGEDQSITMPDDAVLNGNISDDGLPVNSLTATWTKVSGPGDVAFTGDSDPITTASFSMAGSYMLQLTADDGEFYGFDVVIINVAPQDGLQVLNRQIEASTDDAEERADGDIQLISSDLELVFDRSDQTIGMRFNNITIPNWTSIERAYIQFQTDEISSDLTSLIIAGELTGNATTFNSSGNNISMRPRTASTVSWSPPAWTLVGEAGSDQRTPDITTIIEEIVNQPEWSNGNSLVIIMTGTGERVAEAYDGVPTAAPLLYVEYFEAANSAPAVAITAPSDNASFTQGDPVSFTGSASDNEDGDLAASLAWSSSLDGTIGSGASFTTSTLSVGSHTITASVTDSGGLTGTDQITIYIEGVPTTLEVRVSASTDDAEESADGDMRLTSSDLEFVYDGSNQTVGVRFNSVSIPQGASIVRAYIQLQTDEVSSDTTSLMIEAELIGNASPFTSSTGNISTRNRTSNTIFWSPPVWATVGEAGTGQQSPDIGSIIQEIVYQPEWSSGNALVLIISGMGERIAESYDGMPDAAPLLHVEYTENRNTAPTVGISAPADNASFAEGEPVTFIGTANDAEDGDLGTSLVWSSSLDGAIGSSSSFSTSTLSTGSHTITASVTDSGGRVGSTQISVTVGDVPTTLEIRVDASTDDAEEKADGDMRLTSNDLELIYDAGTQKVGIRFNAVTIPHGATIINAYIQFQADEMHSGSTLLDIWGEATDNAVTFQDGDGNISSRTLTVNYISWEPEPWLSRGEAGPNQKTPDLKTLIQEIVDRDEWVSGNSLAIIITGSGERVAESYDGKQDGAPLLYVEYLNK